MMMSKSADDAGREMNVNEEAAVTALGSDFKPRRQLWRFLLPTLVLIFGALAAASYFLAQRQSARDARFLALLNQQQVLAQQLPRDAQSAGRGVRGGFEGLRRNTAPIEASLAVLREGDPERGLAPVSEDLAPVLERIEAEWATLAENAELIASVEDSVIAMRENLEAFDGLLGRLSEAADELVSALTNAGAKPGQTYIAGLQLVMINGVASNIKDLLGSEEGSVTDAEQFGRDALQLALVGQAINGFIDGDATLGIEPVSDAASLETLQTLRELYQETTDFSREIRFNALTVLHVRDATQALGRSAAAVFEQTRALREGYQSQTRPGIVGPRLGNIFAGLAVLCLVLLGVQLTRDARARAAQARERESVAGVQAEEAREREDETRRREEETSRANRRNQAAILRLLDEIGDLADGDLSAQASVTEDITGAIADSINYAIEAMRGLVTNINRASVDVTAAVHNTRGTAMKLAVASERQAAQIAEASGSIRKMATSVQGVSANAALSSQVAKKSVMIANKGVSAVRDTIGGMNSIRETIQETSKRIKRLGESSQEIGEIVALIDDIADQTNILALNAAIQASSAGESGRGFAVVADEVQRLAERAGQATKQIEGLVQTIQSDTSEAVTSMELSTAGVVAGADLAQDAGKSLAEIETVSTNLADLIENISQASRQQAAQAASVAKTMGEIHNITAAARKGTQITARSIGNLAELAERLKTSVAGFRLPFEPDDDATIVDLRVLSEIKSAQASGDSKAQAS